MVLYDISQIMQAELRASTKRLTIRVSFRRKPKSRPEPALSSLLSAVADDELGMEPPSAKKAKRAGKKASVRQIRTLQKIRRKQNNPAAP